VSYQLEVRKLRVRYGAFEAVREVSLNLKKGEIGCLLGPSGCGKTTLLRAIAGFEPVTEGEIRLNGAIISSPGAMTAPEKRKVGMVFQDFALFPHLTVADNIGFGLSQARRDKKQRRVAEMLQLVGLSDCFGSYPHELSGGQQQRVALARAMAPTPDVLLLDEPFSSLDSELREQLAGEVRQILKQNHITAILVTHNQHEAFAMADQVSLMNKGCVAQSGSANDLYHKPRNEFVASFLGEGTVIDVTVDGRGELPNGLGVLDKVSSEWKAGERLRLLIRPEDIKHSPDSPYELKVVARSFRGADYLYQLELPDGQLVPCLVSSHTEAEPGDLLPVKIDLQHVPVFQQPDAT
jgi:iron(III) transport system ATP-binding protein